MQHHKLSIPLYVKRTVTAGKGTDDLAGAVDAWRRSSTELRTAATELFTLLEARDSSL